MQSLSGIEWDVVISGTGLQQSLLALGLSRSNQKVLHVDQNEYYGGAEAAFSLQEVDEWVVKVNAGNIREPFFNATVTTPTYESTGEQEKLSFPRAYTLTLSPQIIYSKSKLLSQLVSSKVYRQLEFQAVGNWWIYDSLINTSTSASGVKGGLKRIPNGREDVFADDSIDVRAKRSLMKFLKFAVNYERQTEIWHPHAEKPLSVFLSTAFALPPVLQTTIVALTLSLKLPLDTSVLYSLPRIARHLTSMGVFGPGFAAVLPKWGGSSEIAQVACRASAVGGGIYILGAGIHSESRSGLLMELTLSNNEVLRTKTLITSTDLDSQTSGQTDCSLAKMIAIVSSDLASFFTATVEGGPNGAVSIIAFPSLSIETDGQAHAEPVYVMAHSSDTGECPNGQCVLYATTSSDGKPKARLETAISVLLKCYTVGVSEMSSTPSETRSLPKILYSVYYEQKLAQPSNICEAPVLRFAGSSLDLVFDDKTLDNIQDAWKFVMERAASDEVSPDLGDTYMRFEDREHIAEEEDYDGA